MGPLRCVINHPLLTPRSCRCWHSPLYMGVKQNTHLLLNSMQTTKQCSAALLWFLSQEALVITIEKKIQPCSHIRRILKEIYKFTELLSNVIFIGEIVQSLRKSPCYMRHIHILSLQDEELASGYRCYQPHHKC